MITYTRYLLAILFVTSICSCKPKPVPPKEVVYKNYSLKQLKSYLQGTWVGLDANTKDTLERPFNFTYKKNSDSAGYLDPQEWKEMHVTFFDLKQVKGNYVITFVRLYGNSEPVWNIEKVTNLEVVFRCKNLTRIYKKILFKRKRIQRVYS